MSETIFSLSFILTLPVWLGIILFPRHPFTIRMVTSPWPFIILGIFNALLFVMALSRLELAALGLSLDSLGALLSEPSGVAAVGAGMFTLNLFVGTWIFRDTRYWAISPLPFLALSFVHGSIGLAAYLFARSRGGKREPGRVVN